MQYIKENYEKLYGKITNASSYGNPVELVTKITDILSGGTVLDLGAGDGRQALYLAAKGFKVTAVDLSEAGLEKLQRLAGKQELNIKTELADLNSRSISGEYDVIIVIAVLQHLKHSSAVRILNEMKAHTRSGGINALMVFTQTGDRYILDRKEDPESFYPEDNWLQKFYSDWQVREHGIITTTEFRKHPTTGLPLQNNIEKLLAQKP